MSKLLQFLKGKGRHGRRGEDYEGRKKAEKKASPLSSGYNSDDEDARSIADRPHADQLPAALTEGPSCQMSPKPFYDYTRLQECYPGYLEMLKTSITMSLEMVWAQAHRQTDRHTRSYCTHTEGHFTSIQQCRSVTSSVASWCKHHLPPLPPLHRAKST